MIVRALAAGTALALILLLLALIADEIRLRIRTWRIVVRPLFRMAGYTEHLGVSPIDAVRGVEAPTSTVGLFKENRQISFYWFGPRGRIDHKNTFCLNNIGLISHHNHVIEREPGEYRIVVLGDEMTAATTTDVSWPDMLEGRLSGDRALLRQVGRTKVSVLNFGWPDAGFPHLSQVWRDKAKIFNPDVILVNLVEHDFARHDTGTPAFFRGRPWTECPGRYVAYTSPAGRQAWLVVHCLGGGGTLRSRDCTADRPFTLFLSRDLAEDPDDLAAVQERIVRDYASVSLRDFWQFSGLLSLRRGTGLTSERPFRAREIETIPVTPVSAAELVAHARAHLRTILDDHSNVVITQNPSLAHLVDRSKPFPMSEALAAADPGIRVIDMRAYLPSDAGVDELRSWFQVPHSDEKWSAEGHRMFADAQAQLVTEMLTRSAPVAIRAPRSIRVRAAAHTETGVERTPVPVVLPTLIGSLTTLRRFSRSRRDRFRSWQTEKIRILTGGREQPGSVRWAWYRRRYLWERIKEAAGVAQGRPDNERDWAAPAFGLMNPIYSVGWLWCRRRFVWQRTKERAGLARGHSRWEHGDWVTPTVGVMNPIYSVSVLVPWGWRYRRFLWQRLKEKVGLARGASRWDGGRDWTAPAMGWLNPIWSLRVGLARLTGRQVPGPGTPDAGTHRPDREERA